MKDFRHKMSFSSKVRIFPEDNNELVSYASDDRFKKYIPKNLGDNPNFLYFAGELFLANFLNANFDGISNQESIKVAEYLPYNPCDIEHSRQKLCGVIVKAFYTEPGTGKELTLDEVKKMKEPFAVTVGGIIWRAPNPNFADELETTKELPSLSWELLLNQINIIEMPKDKVNFSDGKMITDEKEIEKLSKYLRSNGGTGFTPNGLKVGRVPVGPEVYPLGLGITDSPASRVLPIYIDSNKGPNDSTEIAPPDLNAKKLNDNSHPDLKSVIQDNTKPNGNMQNVDDNKVKDVTKDNQPDFTLENPSLKKLAKLYKKDKISIDKYGNSLASALDKFCSNKLEKLSFGLCPECNEMGDSDTKRYPNGKTYCGSCGYMTASKDWKVEEIKNIEFVEKNKTILKEMYNSHKTNQLSKEDYLKQLENYLDVFKGQSPTKDGPSDKEFELNQIKVKEEQASNDLKTWADAHKSYAYSDHFTEKCSCGHIIGTCRCGAPDKKVYIIESGCSECKEKMKKSENSISQVQNPIVKQDNVNIINKENLMKIDKIEQITDENIKEIKASELKEMFASNTQVALQSEIEKISKTYTDKIQEKEGLVKAANESMEAFKKQVGELNENLNKVKTDYDTLKKSNEEREKVESFSSRMEVVEDKFEFNEKQKEMVANKIKSLASDKDFTDYLAEMEVLFDKNKKGQKNPETSTASVINENKVVETAVANGENKDKVIPNNGSTEPTLKEKYLKAFGPDGWQIVNKRINRVM
jgi:hypothetical protein